MTYALALALAVATPSPPTIDSVLSADVLVVDSLFLGDGRSEWPYAFVRTAHRGETWVRLQDPFGGVYVAPLTHIVTIGEDAAAFSEARTGRSVLFVPPLVTLSVLLFGFVGLASAGAVPFVLYRKRYRRERERRRLADAARHHIAEGREAERLRFARDLHDGPVQDLQALRMRLSLISRAPTSTEVQDVASEVQRVVYDLRQASEELRPPALGPFGLGAALRTATSRLAATHPGVDVDADLDEDGQTLPEPVRLALYRIAQEAMSNAVQHGRPSHVAVTFELAAEELRLDVVDDGVGCAFPADLRAPSRPGHYGIVGMVERAESVGGRLYATSEPGRETRVSVRIPSNKLHLAAAR